jgi:hypothetical protein
MGWLALALDSHWQQVHGAGDLRLPTRRLLRVLGAVALLSSLGIALLVDHPSIAPLVWIMGLAASALMIAFTLSWRPQWLGVLSPQRFKWRWLRHNGSVGGWK